MPQEAHLRRRLQEPPSGLAGAFARRCLTKRSRELYKVKFGPAPVLRPGPDSVRCSGVRQALISAERPTCTLT